MEAPPPFDAGNPWDPRIYREPPPSGDAIPRMTVGQLVSQTFAIYMRVFGTAVRIVFFAQIPLLISVFVDNGAWLIVLSLATLFAGLIANGAITYLACRTYLGGKATAAGSYIAAMNNGISLLVNALILAAAAFVCVLLSVIVVGIPLLVFIIIAWFFYVQAVVVEGKGPFDALVRSWQLVRGSWWRVFGIAVVFLVILLVIGLTVSLPGLLVGMANGTLGDLLITLGGLLLAPAPYIAATLVYLDLRARKEDLTLTTLAAELG